MSTRRLEALFNDRLVGHLRETNDLWEFEYTASWAEDPEGFDISPGLPRALRLHRDGASNRPVQWYFDNLLPEENLRNILAAEARLPADDAFGLLAYFGAESAGALLLKSEATPPGERGMLPLSPSALSARIAQLPLVSLARDAPKRMSLAGAQHKLLVVDINGELYEPRPGTASSHILKPDSVAPEYPGSAINEYFTMRLAREVRVRTAAVQHRYVPQSIYIIDRFDRSGTPPDQGRVHAIDACQLLNKSRVFKYTTATLDSLSHAVEYCRERAATRLQLFRWLLFNLLVGNTDNHMKNVTFLVRANHIDIAPAYDLLSTAVYATKALANERATWPHVDLTLRVGNARTCDEVTHAAVVAAGRTLGLSAGTATREIELMTAALPGAAAALLQDMERELASKAAASPDPAAAELCVARDLRVLRAIEHIIIADMTVRLSNPAID